LRGGAIVNQRVTIKRWNAGACKTLRERGEALISIAHPDFRAELRKELANIRHFVVG
jgi:hypothetical protein